jgi:hypothetical protein
MTGEGTTATAAPAGSYPHCLAIPNLLVVSYTV